MGKNIQLKKNQIFGTNKILKIRGAWCWVKCLNCDNERWVALKTFAAGKVRNSCIKCRKINRPFGTMYYYYGNKLRRNETETKLEHNERNGNKA